MCPNGWKRFLWLAIVITSLTQAMLSPAAVLSEEDESDKDVFMFLYRNVTSEVDLSPEDALNSDLIRSEYNLQQEREKRDIESSGDDVNECLDPVLNTCLQNCTNTDGGFNCSCFNGFEGTGNNCTVLPGKRSRSNTQNQVDGLVPLRSLQW
ncbi:uncharacterized protein [Haliotis cracherodii]|uniref:uncharacterized protein n=1 Tax=Haliotis cracherodii TaxID=6455 RepID=UPI0039E98E9A